MVLSNIYEMEISLYVLLLKKFVKFTINKYLAKKILGYPDFY